MGVRPVIARAARRWRRILSAARWPIRGRAARRPSAAACSTPSMVVTPRSEAISIAVLGPMPGMDSRSSMPSGSWPRARS